MTARTLATAAIAVLMLMPSASVAQTRAEIDSRVASSIAKVDSSQLSPALKHVFIGRMRDAGQRSQLTYLDQLDMDLVRCNGAYVEWEKTEKRVKIAEVPPKLREFYLRNMNTYLSWLPGSTQRVMTSLSELNTSMGNYVPLAKEITAFIKVVDESRAPAIMKARSLKGLNRLLSEMPSDLDQQRDWLRDERRAFTNNMIAVTRLDELDARAARETPSRYSQFRYNTSHLVAKYRVDVGNPASFIGISDVDQLIGFYEERLAFLVTLSQIQEKINSLAQTTRGPFQRLHDRMANGAMDYSLSTDDADLASLSRALQK